MPWSTRTSTRCWWRAHDRRGSNAQPSTRPGPGADQPSSAERRPAGALPGRRLHPALHVRLRCGAGASLCHAGQPAHLLRSLADSARLPGMAGELVRACSRRQLVGRAPPRRAGGRLRLLSHAWHGQRVEGADRDPHRGYRRNHRYRWGRDLDDRGRGPPRIAEPCPPGSGRCRRPRRHQRHPARGAGRGRQAGARDAQGAACQTIESTGCCGGDNRVIVCKQCGHHNEDSDTFCGSCGKFLEWTGERVVVAQPEPEPPAPELVPEPAHVGLIDRVKHAVGLEEATPQPAAPANAAASAPVPAEPTPRVVWSVPVNSAARAVQPASPPAPVAAPAAPAPAPVLAGVAAPAAPAAAAAPPTVSVVQADEPVSRRPTSVAPAVSRPRPAPRTMEAPTRRHPGDLICGQCGEGNDPSRHFCRRCGTSLDEALAVRLPWYRRFFNRLFGVRTREAGWRPHRVGPPNVMGGVWRIVRLALGALIIVGLLAFLLVPSFHNGVVNRVTSAGTTVRKASFPHYDAVYATGASASTSIAGHLPNLAIDKFTNTYWAAQASDHGPYLKLSFHDPVDLAQIGFDSGAAGTTPVDDFLAQPRPHLVHLVFSNGTTADLTLKDEDPKVAKNAQFYPIDAKQVSFVEIHIMSVYAPAGASPSAVAIAEVEFRIRD